MRRAGDREGFAGEKEPRAGSARVVETTQPWHVLGFTADDVAGAWQDSRLAEACARAWVRCGRPEGFRILQSASEGSHIIRWYVCERAARLLDAEGVRWRPFRIGECDSVPQCATAVLRR
jgi:hypothetical protein